jgi:uncharacterized protein YndB with AHSA1/START domain
MTQATGMTDLSITRIFDAPRELVYRAFVDPGQLSQWFGPVGFSVPRDSVDVDARAGGHQRFTMVSDANPNDANRIDATFTEVVEDSVLDGYQDVEGIPGTEGIVRFQLRIELHDEPGGKTRLELRQGPYTPEFKAGAAEGWESSFTKLDALLKLA